MYALAARGWAAIVVAAVVLVAPTPTPTAGAVGGGRFVTTWESSEAALCLHGNVDVWIDWGDGHAQVVSGLRPAGTTGPVTHTFDNCFLIRFDGDGRCAEFTELYMERPR